MSAYALPGMKVLRVIHGASAPKPHYQDLQKIVLRSKYLIFIKPQQEDRALGMNYT